jgi:hypothetical protein
VTASSNSAFLAERVRLVFSDSWGSLPINLINAGVVALVHRDVLPVQVPIIWFLFLGSVVGLRIALYIRYRRAEASAAAARLWARRLMLVLMMTGLGWGVGGIVMMSLAPPTYQVLIAFVLGGMAAGGMPSLSRIFTVYVVFVVPILLPACFWDSCWPWAAARNPTSSIPCKSQGRTAIWWTIFVARSTNANTRNPVCAWAREHWHGLSALRKWAAGNGIWQTTK